MYNQTKKTKQKNSAFDLRQNLCLKKAGLVVMPMQEHKLKTRQNGGVDKKKQGEGAGTDSWEEMQEGPSEEAEPLERPEEALERVETVDMRRRVEDMM